MKRHTPDDQAGELSIEEIAARQGVSAITDFDSLLGHPFAEDESPEEFAAMLRAWRREGVDSDAQ